LSDWNHAVLAELTSRGFRFKKNLGQNFLFNTFVLEQIVDAAGISPGDAVVEAGAGAGSLTAVLVDRGAKVIAVELDRSLTPYLNERFQDEPGVEIIQGDIMKLDTDALISERADGEAVLPGEAPYKICANLPYNITTAFMTKAFRQTKGLQAGAVLVQKEVADKVTALPGGDSYGLLALAAAWYGEAEQVMVLPPAYFTPSPPVDSAVVAFRRRYAESNADEKALWLVIRGLFTKRRKNLLNGLKSLGAFSPVNGADWAEALQAAGVDRHRRPETLSLAEFAAIVCAAGYTH
jgi:16S rRNA (adenine1518-N6/adenine1519-N6)-dimethyltransferase